MKPRRPKKEELRKPTLSETQQTDVIQLTRQIRDIHRAISKILPGEERDGLIRKLVELKSRRNNLLGIKDEGQM